MPHTLRIEVSSDHNPAATPVGGQYPVSFIRKQLSADEVYPSSYRYNPTTGNVEYSPDGGTTWEPAPGSDPRYSSTRPPQTGDNAACNSAASEIAYLGRVVEVLQLVGGTGVTATSLAYGIMGVLLEASAGYAIIFAVIVGVAEGLLSAGLTAINLAFSSTNMGILECIIYCHLNSSNQLDATGLSGVQSDVTAQIGGTDATILNAVLSLQGYGGINNAMALRLDTDDCSGCGQCNWCFNFNFSSSQAGWAAVLGSDGQPRAVYTPGAGWTQKYNAAGQDHSEVRIYDNAPTGNVTTVEMEWSSSVALSEINWLGSGAAVNLGGHAAGSHVVSTFTLNRDVTNYRCDIGYPTGNQSMTIHRITAYGTGANPFGDNNCGA